MVKDKDLKLQENISEDEVIDKLSCECCNGDREKGRIVYQEVLKVVREKTVRQRQGQQQEQEQEFLDNIFDSLKGGRGGGLF